MKRVNKSTHSISRSHTQTKLTASELRLYNETAGNESKSLARSSFVRSVANYSVANGYMGIDLMNQTAPLEIAKWIPNETSNCCIVCSKFFGMFRRKHHCRQCGILVCQDCSPYKDYVAGYRDQKVRICRNCTLFKVKRIKENDRLKKFNSARTGPTVLK